MSISASTRAGIHPDTYTADRSSRTEERSANFASGYSLETQNSCRTYGTGRLPRLDTAVSSGSVATIHRVRPVAPAYRRWRDNRRITAPHPAQPLEWCLQVDTACPGSVSLVLSDDPSVRENPVIWTGDS